MIGTGSRSRCMVMSYGGINSGADTGVGSIIDTERDGKEVSKA